MLTRYHWALLIGPKFEDPETRGIRFHAKNPFPLPGQKKWIFEELETSMMPTRQFLVRLLIAKVRDKDRAIEVLRNVPILDEDPSWNCVIWTQDALRALSSDKKALGTRKSDWDYVKTEALRYIEEKIAQHRFDQIGTFDMGKAATYDLLQGRETVP